jgi:uncharacterized membrane protein YfcA
LAVVSIVGTYIGKKILQHFSQVQFKNFVLVLILGTGVYTLLKFIFIYE